MPYSVEAAAQQRANILCSTFGAVTAMIARTTAMMKQAAAATAGMVTYFPSSEVQGFSLLGLPKSLYPYGATRLHNPHRNRRGV